MTGAFATFLLNIVIVALLLATIGYCWRLNRRIRILQDSKSELAQLLKHFDESTQRASESIIALQTASKKIGENIQFRIDKANYLLEDLSFMIERGNKLANQMEAGFAVTRARSRVLSEAPPDNQETSAEQEKPVPPPAPVIEKPAEKLAEAGSPTHREKTVATLEAVLERVAGRQKTEPEPVRERPVASPARSKAEQELLEMIRAGMKG